MNTAFRFAVYFRTTPDQEIEEAKIIRAPQAETLSGAMQAAENVLRMDSNLRCGWRVEQLFSDGRWSDPLSEEWTEEANLTMEIFSRRWHNERVSNARACDDNRCPDWSPLAS